MGLKRSDLVCSSRWRIIGWLTESRYPVKNEAGLVCAAFICLSLLSILVVAKSTAATRQENPKSKQSGAVVKGTAQAYNQRLLELARDRIRSTPAEDYRIGPGDLLEISVYGAPDLSRTVRVPAQGSISLPLIGSVDAAGLTSHELERVVEALLRRNYMTDPQVNVFVKEVKSHPVSVFGAVERPGVYQIQGPESLIEVLSMAQGLADDAGDRVIVMRRGETTDNTYANRVHPRIAEAVNSPISPAKPEPIASGLNAGDESLQVDLKDLLASPNPAYNVEVNPGDIVKVPRAGIVYVVGEVRKPGGFLLRTNENISVLQALALAEGTTSTSSEKGARIIRTGKNGSREEIPINLKRILTGKAADPMLASKDILFIPNSATRAAFYRGTEAALSITGGLIVYRR